MEERIVSKYGNDLRVRLHGDGTASLSGDAWQVRAVDGGFEVHNPAEGIFVEDEAAWYASQSRVPRRFADRDAAIHALIGPPVVAS
jgi:hypothetical protein